MESKALARASQSVRRFLDANPLLAALVGSSLVSLVLYVAGAVFNHGFYYYFLVWNLFLAWLPLLFIYILLKILKGQQWSDWPALGISFLWLLFLPNSFYLISDFVHLYDVFNANVMYNIAMLASFAFSGLILGYTSLRAVHQQLLSRGHRPRLAWWIVVVVLFLSSYAVYLGRIIRLNSWDFFTNFGAVLYSVSDQVVRPGNWPPVIGITVSLFVLLMTIYVVLWWLKPVIITNNETGA